MARRPVASWTVRGGDTLTILRAEAAVTGSHAWSGEARPPIARGRPAPTLRGWRGPAATPEHPRVQGMGADTTLHPEGEARSHDAAVRPDLGRLPRSAATSAIEVSKRLTRLQAPLHLRGRSGRQAGTVKTRKR